MQGHIQNNIYSIEDNILLTLMKMDLFGKITFWSRGLQEIFQYTAAEMLGESFTKLVPIEFMGDSIEIVNQLIKGSRKNVCIKRIGKKKDGSLVSFELAPSRIIENEKIIGLILVIKDDTHSKRISEDLKNYKYIIDKSAMFIVTDNKGVIRDANENFCEKHLYERDEVLGTKIKMFSNEEVKAYLKNIDKCTAVRDTIWRGEIQESKSDGELFWTDNIIIPCLNEHKKVFKFLIVKYDSTQRKTEEEVAQQNHLMQKSLIMKDEFLANMSHEIRTPLNAIIGYSELLLETVSAPAHYKKVSAIKQSSRLLLSLVNDILDLSKLESKKIIFDNSVIDLPSLVNSVKEILDINAFVKGVSLTVDLDRNLPRYVKGDSVRLEQIFLNLLNNAIKFTKIGFVKFSTHLIWKNKNTTEICFRFIDSGIGIEKDKLNLIFNSFTQTSKYVTREFGGSGLGLTIVKKLVEQMKGEISVVSKIKEGTQFELKLTFKTPSETEIITYNNNLVNKNSYRYSEALNLNILLAEDNEFNQALAVARLQKWHCNVDVAKNGLEVLEMLEKSDYDLIFMDIQMPLLDGYEATRRIRKEFKGIKGQIPIVALTAHASNGDKQNALKVGFNGYLFKPFNLSEMYAVLRNYSIEKYKDKKATSFVKKKIRLHNSESIELTSVETVLQVLPSSNLVDFSHLESEALGDQGILKILISTFLSEFKRFTTNANESIKKLDWKATYADVHRIAPSVYNFKIAKLSEKIKELQVKSEKEIDTETFKILLGEIEFIFLEIEPLLDQKLNNLTIKRLNN